MDMVERCAKAMIIRKAKAAGAYSSWMDVTPLDGFEGAAQAREDARAAIAVMHSPTEAMITAGHKAAIASANTRASSDPSRFVTDIYTAMFAALATNPQP